MKIFYRILFVMVLTFTSLVTFIPNDTFAYRQMTINPVTNADRYVSGMAQSGGEVYVEVDGNVIGGSYVYSSTYLVDIPKLKADKKVVLYYVYNGDIYEKHEVKVIDVVPPARPDILYPVSTTAGFVYGSGEKGATVSVYKGDSKLGSAKALDFGDFSIPIPPQTLGTVLKVYQTDSAGNRSNVSMTTVYASSTTKKQQLSKKKYTVVEKEKITKEFLTWAGTRAKAGNMAVTDLWFNHGAAGFGDWYADTPQGEVQVQDFNNPGYYGFKIHAIGGVVYYTPRNNKFGISNDAYNQSTGDGYSKIVKPKTMMHKYMLADNGVVYEIVSVKEKTYTGTGFAEYNDDGKRHKGYVPTEKFKVSADKAAQQKYKQILSKYK